MPTKSCHLKWLLDEYDLSGDSFSATLRFANETIDASHFQECATLSAPSPGENGFELQGYYTGPAAGQLEHELSTRLLSGAPATVTVIPDNRALGNPAYVRSTQWLNQLTLAAPVKQLITLTGGFMSGEVLRGLLVADHERTATGRIGAAARPAGTPLSGTLWVHVTELDGPGPGPLTVQAESYSTVGLLTPTSHGVLSVSALGVGMAAVTGVGSLQNFVGVNVTSLGGFVSVRLSAVICLEGVTY